MLKQKSKTNCSPLCIYFLIGTAVVLTLLFLFSRNNAYQSPTSVSSLVSSSPSPDLSSRTFTASSVMGGFTIDVPEGFEVEEKNTIIILRKNNSSINIYKTGTNYSSLKEIFNSEKDLKNKDINYLKINKLEAGSELNNNEKTYYVYSSYELFSITTQDKNLFSTLDQLAQSFRLPKE